MSKPTINAITKAMMNNISKDGDVSMRAAQIAAKAIEAGENEAGVAYRVGTQLRNYITKVTDKDLDRLSGLQGDIIRRVYYEAAPDVDWIFIGEHFANIELMRRSETIKGAMP